VADREDLQIIELAARRGLLSPQEARGVVDRARRSERGWQPGALKDEAVRDGLLSEAEFDYLAILVRRGLSPGGSPVVDERPSLWLPGLEGSERISDDELYGVHLARRCKDGRRVLVYVLNEVLSSDPAVVSELSRQAEAAKTFRHPHVLPLLESTFAGGRYCFVFDAPEGESLATRVARDGPLAEPEALAVAMQLAGALEAAAAASLPHRNVTPSAVFISASGVKLAGVGCSLSALRAAAASGLSPDNALFYVAPEVVRGDAGSGFCSQQYSLGALLYFAATGQPPFSADSAAVLLSEHLSVAPPLPAAHRPELSKGLCDVVERLLAKDPSARYPSAARLVEDLEAVRSGAAVSPQPRGEAPAQSNASEDPGGTRSERERPRTSTARLVFTLVAAVGLVAGSIGLSVYLYARFLPLAGRSGEGTTTQISRDERARRALQYADAYAQEHPDLMDQARRNYELLQEEFPDSQWASEAAARLDAMTAAVTPPPAEPSAADTSPATPVVESRSEHDNAIAPPVPPPDGRPDKNDSTGTGVEPVVDVAAWPLKPPRSAPTAALRAAFAKGRQRCYIAVACDGVYVLYVNGKAVGRGGGFSAMDIYPATLRRGDVIAVQAQRGRVGGLIVEVFLDKAPLSFGSDETWRYVTDMRRGWNRRDAPPLEWQPVRIVGFCGGRRWGRPGDLVDPVGRWIWGEERVAYFRTTVDF